MAKQNPMLAKIEAKYAAEYEMKLAVAKAQYMLQLQIGFQQCCDAAIMAIDDVFDVNAYSAEKFVKTHIEYMNEISHMVAVEDADDPSFEWTKAKVDERLLKIVGAENFVPWEERYRPDKERR